MESTRETQSIANYTAGGYLIDTTCPDPDHPDSLVR